MRIIKYLFIFIICSPWVAGAEQDQTQTEAQPLRIGVIQSLTGIAAVDGENVTRALQLAADEINDVSELKIQLIIEDDGTNPKSAVTAYHRLRAAGVDAIVGATWAFLTNPLIPLAAKDKMVLINTTTIPEALELNSGEGFAMSNYLTVKEEVKPVFRFLKTRKAKKIVILANNTSWAQVQVKEYRKFADSNGIKILEEIETERPDKNEWRSLLPRVVSSKPDAIVMLLVKNDTDMVIRRLSELGADVPICSSRITPDSLQDSGHKELYEGICFGYPYKRLVKAQDFFTAFKKRFKEDPRIYADNSYDVVFMLHEAAKKFRKSGLSLRDAIQSLSYQGISGKYQYSTLTSLTSGTNSLVCIKGDKMVLDN